MYKPAIRSLASLLIVLFLLLTPSLALAAPEDYDVNTPEALTQDELYGESAVAIDADTGEILFSKNARVRMYPASTTKVMTLLLAVESGWSLDTPVTIPPEAAAIPSDSSTVPVYPGEVMSFGDLLYGLMLHSGNDAANAVAVLVSGSIPAFVQRMNERAVELGCTGTHFANAHGYHDENHYSTAMDLALITREALKHDEVRTIVSTTSYTMHIFSSNRTEIPLSNTNAMLNSGNTYYFEECIGVKTGTHSRAGQCFVGAAVRDGVTLVTVTLNCSESVQRWIDSIRLFRYGFTRYTPYSLEQMFDLTSSRFRTTRLSNAADNDEYDGVLQLKITQVSDSSYQRMIQTDSDGAMAAALDDFVQRAEIHLVDNLAAPVSMGEIVGSFSYTTQDGQVITASLIAARDIAAQPERMTIYDLFPFLHAFDNPLVTLLAIVLLLLVLSVALYFRARRRRIERRRRELYEQRRREYMRRQHANGGAKGSASVRKTSSANRNTAATRRPPTKRSAAATRRPTQSSSRSSRHIDNDDLF